MKKVGHGCCLLLGASGHSTEHTKKQVFTLNYIELRNCVMLPIATYSALIGVQSRLEPTSEGFIKCT